MAGLAASLDVHVKYQPALAHVARTALQDTINDKCVVLLSLP